LRIFSNRDSGHRGISAKGEGTRGSYSVVTTIKIGTENVSGCACAFVDDLDGGLIAKGRCGNPAREVALHVPSFGNINVGGDGKVAQAYLRKPQIALWTFGHGWVEHRA